MKMPNNPTADLKIVTLTDIDAKRKTDRFIHLKSLVLQHEQMYPSIDKWFNKKVLPGLKNSERICILGYIDNRPAASAIVKKGFDSKFCHLNVSNDIHDNNIGEMFFALMTERVRGLAQSIHFTLPESLWEGEKGFFKSFGFEEAIKAATQYRLFEEELMCSAPTFQVWNMVIAKLPKLSNKFSIGGYSLNNSLVMSIHPENARKILQGEKSVEIRRRFNRNVVGYNINLYTTSPVKGLVGEARIANVDVNNPQKIWECYCHDIGASKEEFDKYVGEAEEVFAVLLDEVRPYRDYVPLSQLSHIIEKELRPPQSYYRLSSNKAWADAISAAAVLHGEYFPRAMWNFDEAPVPSKKKIEKEEIQLTFFND